MRIERITSEELLRRYEIGGVRRFTGISISNQSFRGVDLSGIEFVKSSIRGCDFQDTNFENSSFIESSFGISFRQHILMLVYRDNQIFDIPISVNSFGFLLLFPFLWLYGVSIVFLAITSGLIGDIWSIFWNWLGGTIEYRQALVSMLLYSIPLFMVTALLVFDIKRTFDSYFKRRTESVCTNLRNANLSNVVFCKSKIFNCDLSNSRLIGSSIENSEIENSIFLSSNLKGLSLRGSRLFNSQFSISDKILRLLTTLDGREEDYRDCDLSGFNFSYANLKGANLSGAKLIGTNLSHANLTSVILDSCDARGAKFDSSILKRSSLFAIDLSAGCLINADVRDANLAASRVMGVDFSGADLSGACISDWQISNTKFEKVKCTHVFLEFSYQLKEYMTRVPANEQEFLESREFENNVSQVYRLMARILQYGPEYIDEIKKEISFAEKSSKNDQSFRESLDRLKKLVDTFENRVLSKPKGDLFMQVINSFYGDVMSGETNKKTAGGNIGGDNTIRAGRDISNSSGFYQDASLSWSTQEENSREDILQTLDQILELLSNSKLSDSQKKEVIAYVDSAKQETGKEVPKKERITQNLEWFKESLESLNGTTDAVKSLITKLRVPWATLTRFLSITIPFLP